MPLRKHHPYPCYTAAYLRKTTRRLTSNLLMGHPHQLLRSVACHATLSDGREDGLIRANKKVAGSGITVSQGQDCFPNPNSWSELRSDYSAVRTACEKGASYTQKVITRAIQSLSDACRQKRTH